MLGYPVDSIDIRGAIDRIAEFTASDSDLRHVVAINANKLWLAEQNAELSRILRRAELVIPEYAVVWACRRLRRPVVGHVGGVMLLKALLPWLEQNQVPAYFLGAKPQVLERMRWRLAMMYPRLTVSGMHSGYFDGGQERQIVQQINNSGAAILFVAMGTPRQELWIESHRRELATRVAMGVGGSFDVLAGIKKDAPAWVRHGGEWLYRLLQDPRNLWKRYSITNPWFVYRVLRQALAEKGPEQAPNVDLGH